VFLKHSLVALFPCVCSLEDGVRPGTDVVREQGVKNHLKQVFEPSRGVMVVNASVTDHFGKLQKRGGLNSLPAPVRAGEDAAEDDVELQQAPGLQDQDEHQGPQDSWAGQSAPQPQADMCADYGETPQTMPRVNGGGGKDDESSGSSARSPIASPLRKRLRESLSSNEPDGESEIEARGGRRARHPVGVLGKGEEEVEEEEAGDKKGQDMLGKGGDAGARASKVGKVRVAPKARAAADKNASDARHLSILDFVKGDAQRARAAGSARENSVAQDEDDDMQVVQVDDEEEEPSMANGNERGRSHARRKDSGVAAQMEMMSDDDVQAADRRMARNASKHVHDQDQQSSLGKVFPTRRGRQADGDDDADNAAEGRAFLSKPRHAGKQNSRDQEQVTVHGKEQELSQGDRRDVHVDVDEPVASGGVSTSVDAGHLPACTHLLCARVHPCTWYVGTHVQVCVGTHMFSCQSSGEGVGEGFCGGPEWCKFVEGLNGASLSLLAFSDWTLVLEHLRKPKPSQGLNSRGLKDPPVKVSASHPVAKGVHRVRN
jgi:hypothetical protein